MSDRRFPRFHRLGLATLDAGSATEGDCLVINASATGLLIELPSGRSTRSGARHSINLDGLELVARVVRIELNMGPGEGHTAGLEIDVDAVDTATLRSYSQWILRGMDSARIRPARAAA